MTTTQSPLPATTIAVWDEALARLAAGLDFADADDRAIFRSRVQSGTRRMKTWGLRTLAAAYGQPVAGNASHSAAARAVADAWISKVA